MLSAKLSRPSVMTPVSQQTLWTQLLKIAFDAVLEDLVGGRAVVVSIAMIGKAV